MADVIKTICICFTVCFVSFILIFWCEIGRYIDALTEKKRKENNKHD